MKTAQIQATAHVVAAMFLATFTLAGCQPVASSDKSAGKSTSRGATDKPDQATKSDKKAPVDAGDPYLADWKTPAAAIVFSGEIHGYLEPCGCSLTQSGGFARRAKLIRELGEKKWPLAALDLGGTLKKAKRQDQIKFESILTAMQKLSYDGMALGPEELQLGPDVIVSQHVVDDPKSVSFLDANVVLFDSPELGTPIPSKVITVGDVKIGVAAVLGKSHRDTVAPDGVNTNITVDDPIEKLPDVIAKLQAEKPDFLVLLSHGSVEEAKELAGKFPQFRIIQTAGGPDEASGKPIVVKDTWILETGIKGRAIGVLGYYPDNAKQPFRFELVELDSARFPGEDDDMTVIMKNYQQRLQDEKIAQSPQLLMPAPPGGTYVGAETCGECHTKAYKIWKETGHAKATATLLHGRGDEKEWVQRQFDPECLSCHVTGWEPQKMMRFESGYFSQDQSQHLFGNQCENCHGPGSEHTDLERKFAKDVASVEQADLEKLRELVARSYDTAEKQVCLQCHDSENSPGFKYADYWESVKHPWRD